MQTLLKELVEDFPKELMQDFAKKFLEEFQKDLLREFVPLFIVSYFVRRIPYMYNYWMNAKKTIEELSNSIFTKFTETFGEIVGGASKRFSKATLGNIPEIFTVAFTPLKSR